MARTKAKRRSVSSKGVEPDTEYVLKLALYLAAGSVWLRIISGETVLPLPIGLAVGLWFTRREKLQIDRKIEYAILLMSMFFGYWLMPSINIIL